MVSILLLFKISVFGVFFFPSPLCEGGGCEWQCHIHPKGSNEPLDLEMFFYRYVNLPEKILEPFEIIFLNTLALRSQILTDLNPLEKIPGAATM